MIQKSRLTKLFKSLNRQQSADVLLTKMQYMRGWIAIEGPDGCGKGTLLNNFESYLSEALSREDYLRIRYPGGNKWAEVLRKTLKRGEPGKFEPEEEAELFATARYLAYDKTIHPARQQGLIISDRWLPSAYAYQGAARGMGVDAIREVNERLCDEVPDPDFVFVLDTNPDISYKRVMEAQKAQGEINDRFIKFGRQFQHDVVADYHRQASEDPDRYVLVDANGTPEQTARNFMQAFMRIVMADKLSPGHGVNRNILDNAYPGTRDKVPDILNARDPKPV